MLWMLINLHDFACQFYWSACHAGIKGTLYQTVFLQPSRDQHQLAAQKPLFHKEHLLFNSGLLLVRLLNIQGQRHTVLEGNL